MPICRIMEVEETKMEDAKMFAAMIGVLVCDLALLCADVIVTGNPALWAGIRVAECLYIEWLMNNSVEVREEN